MAKQQQSADAVHMREHKRVVRAKSGDPEGSVIWQTTSAAVEFRVILNIIK
jgi:hypothetical protein